MGYEKRFVLNHDTNNFPDKSDLYITAKTFWSLQKYILLRPQKFETFSKIVCVVTW